jgi:hypothetical protein
VLPAFYKRQLPISPDSDIYLSRLGRVVRIRDMIVPGDLGSGALEQFVDAMDLLLKRLISL